MGNFSVSYYNFNDDCLAMVMYMCLAVELVIFPSVAVSSFLFLQSDQCFFLFSQMEEVSSAFRMIVFREDRDECVGDDVDMPLYMTEIDE